MFKLEFKTSNAAFEQLDSELTQIFKKIVQQVSEGRNGGRIIDSNGNTVGSWSYQE